MVEYRGSCHCGAITFTFSSREISDGLRCTCSICRRKGAVMTNFVIPPESIDVDSQEGAMSTYRFDDGVAKHHFCNRCGIFTFVETRLNPGQYRVNLGCVDGVDSLGLPIEVFDGDSI